MNSSTKVRLRQLLVFGLAGSCAFLVDVSVLYGLIASNVPPLAARLISILCAMVVAWLLNRQLTFQVKTPPSWREFGRYAALAWFIAALNYLIFALLIASGAITHPLIATATASIIAMGLSFIGMKKGVFHQKPN